MADEVVAMTVEQEKMILQNFLLEMHAKIEEQGMAIEAMREAFAALQHTMLGDC